MVGLQYLTVQDVLWIHLRITGEKAPFDYAQLEQAAFYQYGLGRSTDVLGQASRLLVGFPKSGAFPAGNKGAAFLFFAAFVRLNGYDLVIGDSAMPDWLSGVWQSPAKAGQEVQSAVAKSDGHENSLHDIVDDLLERYPGTIAVLKGQP